MNLMRLLIIAALAAAPALSGCAPQAGDGVDFGKGFGVDAGFKAVDMCLSLIHI